MFGEIFDKLKAVFTRVESIGEKEAHELATQIVPVLENFKDEVVKGVRAEIGDVEAQAVALVDAVKPLLRQAVQDILSELQSGSARTEG